MQWIEAKVEFDSRARDIAVDVIAGIFYDLGVGGVVIDDPDLEPVEDWGETPVGRPQHPAVTGFLPLSSEGLSRLEGLKRELARVADRHPIHTRLQVKEIDDEKWAESWKTFFKPVWISEDMVIKPSWETVSSRPDTLVIDIDPGMAFGTGGHPTTILSLRLIRTYLKRGDAFLDVGTGSGILAIGAAKLGAAWICAVDIDETAVAVAADNFRRNGLPRDRCRVIRARLAAATRAAFDMVAANILPDVILELIDDLGRVAAPECVFICSGIVPRHEERIISALKDHRFGILRIETMENWVAIAARRQRR